METRRGKIYVVGLGPGSAVQITQRALAALAESEVVVGYRTYVNLIQELVGGKEVLASGMRQEVGRAQEAVRAAMGGRVVAVVCSGDPGIYGMAGLVLEVLRESGWERDTGVEVEVVPGVPALSAASALLGAPLMHDFAAISLSDLLTPWETIARRLALAAEGDFVIVLYNPRSNQRTDQLTEAQRIIAQYRSDQTPVGIVRNAYRQGQQVVLTDLGHLLAHEVDMLTTVIIGNSTTVSFDGLMVTPRGYGAKYQLVSTK